MSPRAENTHQFYVESKSRCGKVVKEQSNPQRLLHHLSAARSDELADLPSAAGGAALLGLLLPRCILRSLRAGDDATLSPTRRASSIGLDCRNFSTADDDPPSQLSLPRLRRSWLSNRLASASISERTRKRIELWPLLPESIGEGEELPLLSVLMSTAAGAKAAPLRSDEDKLRRERRRELSRSHFPPPSAADIHEASWRGLSRRCCMSGDVAYTSVES